MFQEHAVLVPFDHHVRVPDRHQSTLEVSWVVFHQTCHGLHGRLELGWSRSFLLEHIFRRQLCCTDV